MAQLQTDALDSAEATLRSEILSAELRAFRKRPDASLADTLIYQKTSNWTPLPNDARGYR